MTLHLQPLAPAEAATIVAFPNTAQENDDALLGQLENIQALLIERHGVSAGRFAFGEAAVAVIARKAREENSAVATLFAVVVHYETWAGLRALGEVPLGTPA